MMRRALLAVLATVLASSVAVAQGPTDLRGTAGGLYDDACLGFISEGQHATLNLFGSFFFGGVPYRGPMNVGTVSYVCGAPHTGVQVPFQGKNVLNGKKISGTCIESFTADPPRFTAHLNCVGRVISATGVGPRGRQRLVVDAILIRADLGCGILILDCGGPELSHPYDIYGIVSAA